MSSASNHVPAARNLILHLPPELVLQIAEDLGKEDLVCTALTCKDMNATLGMVPEVRPMSSRETRNFLSRLERDLGSTHVLCSFCNALHGFCRNPMVQSFSEVAGQTCTVAGFLPMLRWTGYTRGLGYNTARLLANHHRYGPGHGLHIDDIFPDNRDTLIFPLERLAPLRWHVRVEGKFVSGDLMVKATHRLRAEPSRPILQSESITHHPLCRHHVAEHFLADLFAPEGSYVRDGSFRGAVASLLRGMVKGCNRCETDWYLNVSRGPAAAEVAVTVTTYHRFGDISSHEDRAWRNIAGCCSDWSPGRGRVALGHRRYQRGSVCAAWDAGG